MICGSARPHFDDDLDFFDVFEFLDGFDSTASSDLSFDSFAGLLDLSLIDGLAFFDDLDLIRFLSIFNDSLHLDRGDSWGFRCSLPGQRHIVGS